MDDRQVHAASSGLEIVRYGSTNKWYVESLRPRKAVSMRLAAAIAWSWGAESIRFGVPGGSAFDREVRRLFRVIDP